MRGGRRTPRWSKLPYLLAARAAAARAAAARVAAARMAAARAKADRVVRTRWCWSLVVCERRQNCVLGCRLHQFVREEISATAELFGISVNKNAFLSLSVLEVGNGWVSVSGLVI